MDGSHEIDATILSESPIVLAYGTRQKFRLRIPDINIVGKTNLALPVKGAHYTMNGAQARSFYVEPEPPGNNESGQYETGSVLRLNAPGLFNIEIPTDSSSLAEGHNTLQIEIEDASGRRESETVEFTWDSAPLPLPLDLCDLSQFPTIQDVGQVVDGRFEIDHDSNTIRSIAPVAWDALLVLGSPNRSQEATYDVTFGPWQPETVYAGTSDFFTSHDMQSPQLDIKPGYSSAGLAAIRPNGGGETWIMCGQLLKGHDWTWRRVGRFAAPVEPGTAYSVRHRVVIENSLNWVQFKIWPKDDAEPKAWMGDSDTASLRQRSRKIEVGSFGLAQYGGLPTAWSNIRVRAVEVDDEIMEAIRKKTRPGSIAAVRVRDLFVRIVRRLRRFGREMPILGERLGR